jgi:hypothetical protein
MSVKWQDSLHPETDGFGVCRWALYWQLRQTSRNDYYDIFSPKEHKRRRCSCLNANATCQTASAQEQDLGQLLHPSNLTAISGSKKILNKHISDKILFSNCKASQFVWHCTRIGKCYINSHRPGFALMSNWQQWHDMGWGINVVPFS